MYLALGSRTVTSVVLSWKKEGKPPSVGFAAGVVGRYRSLALAAN